MGVSVGGRSVLVGGGVSVGSSPPQAATTSNRISKAEAIRILLFIDLFLPRM
jgi:hypothetical protein